MSASPSSGLAGGPSRGCGRGEDPAPEAFELDGEAVPFEPGQTILQAALAAGRHIPHLCYHPEFRPHGSCKLCTVKVNGWHATSCTTPARAGLKVESETRELNDERRMLVQLLFVEGNHFCPSCEKSGDCKLQAVAYDLRMTSPRFDHFFPDRPVDASHPDILLDFNRCILCELCVRASAEVDGKSVLALGGRGLGKHLEVNSPTGLLRDSTATVNDKAMAVCPVGAILPKRRGFAVPIGQRRYDLKPLHQQAQENAPRAPEPTT
ncbi:MAG TPA: 2Fe-2S iron-sulfur cluster-binding protein [Steroidobacteraceae bacterium]|nr:2Fe-2S iron-sulfur cluster-binding protein [Steroidobacteraceae bacterium]